MEKTILDKNGVATRVKHVALTGYVRKNWKRDPRYLQQIISDCDVSGELGALPPQLRARVPKAHLPQVTTEFRAELEYFLMKNIFELGELDSDRVYDLTQIGNLFGTKCALTARGINVYGVKPWSGAVGYVCKLSFPEINVHYALKLYHINGPIWGERDHGAWFEVATAFAANKAEARDNNQVYMASLSNEPYLLSQWAGDTEDKIEARKNTNQIFVTTDKEDESRNRRGGRRIDWGETFLTDYGAMSYPARKVYRQIMACDAAAVKKSVDAVRDGLARRDLDNAIRLADLTAYYDDNVVVQNFINSVCQR